MVKIRLQRGGAKKHAHYRVVAIDERRSGRGRALEFLGTYDPNFDPVRIRLDAEGIQAWVAKGAQLSDTVRSLLKQSAQAPSPVSGKASSPVNGQASAPVNEVA